MQYIIRNCIAATTLLTVLTGNKVLHAQEPPAPETVLAERAPAMDKRAEELLSRPVTAVFYQLPLRRALQIIAQHAGVRVQYQSEALDSIVDSVSLSAQYVPLSIALYRVLDGTPLHFIVSGDNLLTIKARPAEIFTAQDSATTVSGRVIASDSSAIPGATVRILGDSGTISGVTTTDGTFSIPVPKPPGRWGIIVTAPGFLRHARPLPEYQHGIPIHLPLIMLPADTIARQLAEVKVQASRYPDRREGILPTSGELTVENAVRDQLDFLLQTLPGSTLTPDGVENENAPGMLLDGIPIMGNLPSAFARYNLNTGSADPSASGESSMSYLSPFESGQEMLVNLSNPFMPWSADRIRNRLESSTQRFAFRKSTRYTGLPPYRTWQFDSDFSQSVGPAVPLQRASDPLLTRYGIAPDSAQRLLTLLQDASVPLGSIPSNVTRRSGSILARMAMGSYLRKYTGTAFLTGSFADTRSRLAPIQTATQGIQSQQYSLQLGATLSSQVWGRYLNNTSLSLSTQRASTDATSSGTQGTVLVNSELAGESLRLASFRFGGSQTPASNNRAIQFLLKDELVTTFRGNTHRVNFGAEVRMNWDQSRQDQTTSGSYTFQSLADLENGQAASYTRTLGGYDVGIATRTFAGWISDRWRIRPNVIATLGGRVTHFALPSTPLHNQTLFAQTGYDNAEIPTSVQFEPRLNLTWQYGLARTAKRKGYVNATYVASHASIGPGNLTSLFTNTGLPSGIQRVSCVGDAVPVIDWDVFAGTADAPETCADGQPAFTDARPAIQLFSPAFRPSRSDAFTLNLANQGSRTPWRISLHHRITQHVPSFLDLNFSGTPYFTLAQENDRPVFVEASAVVAESGNISPLTARLYDQWGNVRMRTSDGRQRMTQVIITGSRSLIRRTMAQYSYSYSTTSRYERGFAGSTSGDPRELQWTRPTNQHVLSGLFGVRLPFNMMVSTNIQVRSGFRYTPLVDRDINGDGMANDRPFIPALSGTLSPIAQEMQTFLAAAPKRVRDCLQAYTGRIVPAQACSTPPSTSMNIVINRHPTNRQDFPTTWTLRLTNVAAAFDRLLHGTRGARGWGSMPLPDPILYHVTGFDPATRSFQYTVNSRFGDVDARRTSYSTPIGVTLEVRIFLGRSLFNRQGQAILRSMEFERKKSAGLTPDAMTWLLIGGADFHLFRNVLDADSLQLTDDQIAQIQELRQQAETMARKAVQPIADSILADPERRKPLPMAETLERANTMAKEIVHARIRERLFIILSPIQLEMLPSWTRSTLESIRRGQSMPGMRGMVL